MTSVASRGRTWIAAGLLLAGSAAAQRDLPNELERAAHALRNDDPQAAFDAAHAYLEELPAGHYALAAMLLAGRAELRLDRPAGAIDRAYDVLARCSGTSEYRPHAYYLLATAHEARGDQYEAARALVEALEAGARDDLEQDVLDHLAELMNGPAAYRARDLLLVARRENTRRVLATLLPSAAETPTIGLLLPDPDAGSRGADSLLAGVETALASWEDRGGEHVELALRWIDGDPARAVDAARDLVRNAGVWALIAAGPDAIVVPAAVEAQAAGTPVVIPGNGRPALRALGPSVVLPTPDWRLEGKLAAQYATDVLELETFGIVAPYTDRGRETVAGFLDVLAERENVTVLDQEWYRPEEGVSLATQFRRLRTIGFKREFRDRLIERELHVLDSLWAVVDSFGLAPVDSIAGRRLVPAIRDSVHITDEQLEREWQEHLIEVRQSPEFKSGKLDSNAIELKAYDALYLPIERGTIATFAPQFAFYNFHAVRLGNSAWYDPDELLRHRQYVQHLGFTAPFNLTADNDPLWMLNEALADTSNRTVTPWHVFGWDAAGILLHAMAGGEEGATRFSTAPLVRRGPGEIALALRNLGEIQLAAGRHVFAETAPVAQAIWFLMVKDGFVEPLLPQMKTPAELEREWGLPRAPADSSELTLPNMRYHEDGDSR